MTGSAALRTVARWVLLSVFFVGMTFEFVVDWRTGLTLLPYFGYAAIGLLVTDRQPANPVGWLFLGVGAVSGLIAGANAAMTLAERSGRPDAGYAIAAAWAANFLWIDALTLALILTLLLFPHGLLTPRWRPVLWLTLATATALSVEAAFAPTVSVGTHSYPNPLHRAAWGGLASGAWNVLLGVLGICGLLALMSTILRFRRATGVERVQMRWFVFSCVVLLVSLLVPGLNNNDYVFAVVSTLVPVACGTAILRYHLYDIDRIISRTTSYAVVTALLLGTYGVVVTLVLRVLPDSSNLAVAAATLSAAALARPVLRRVQGIVDRRFNRARFDALHTLDQFGARLRHEVDPELVAADLVSVVHGTLEPSHAYLTLVVRS